jgi:hypothetical protein
MQQGAEMPLLLQRSEAEGTGPREWESEVHDTMSLCCRRASDATPWWRHTWRRGASISGLVAGLRVPRSRKERCGRGVPEIVMPARGGHHKLARNTGTTCWPTPTS